MGNWQGDFWASEGNKSKPKSEALTSTLRILGKHERARLKSALGSRGGLDSTPDLLPCRRFMLLEHVRLDRTTECLARSVPLLASLTRLRTPAPSSFPSFAGPLLLATPCFTKTFTHPQYSLIQTPKSQRQPDLPWNPNRCFSPRPTKTQIKQKKESHFI